MYKQMSQRTILRPPLAGLGFGQQHKFTLSKSGKSLHRLIESDQANLLLKQDSKNVMRSSSLFKPAAD